MESFSWRAPTSNKDFKLGDEIFYSTDGGNSGTLYEICSLVWPTLAANPRLVVYPDESVTPVEDPVPVSFDLDDAATFNQLFVKEFEPDSSPFIDLPVNLVIQTANEVQKRGADDFS